MASAQISQPIPLLPPSEPAPIQKLTTKNLFKHFFLVHDFLQKFTTSRAKNSDYLNAQIQIKDIMTKAADRGGIFGRVSSFAALVVYCLRGKSLSLKFFAGFLYIYWMNHQHTLGQYLGVLLKMPSAYEKLSEYYSKPSHANQYPQLLNSLNSMMDSQVEYDYQDTDVLLRQIFPQQYKTTSTINPYVQNNYFQKNREKYKQFQSATPKSPKQGGSSPASPGSPQSSPSLGPNSDLFTKKSKKLPYLDSFITRYVFYSFTRWFWRLKLFLGLQNQ